MASMVTYLVDRMRVTRPKGKTAERNPERVYTVSGIFYSTQLDENGALVRKDKLTIPSKNLDREDVLAEGFALDLATGTVTVPEGRRGRTAEIGLSAEDIAKELNSLRNPEPVVEVSTVEASPEPKGKDK